MYKTTLKIDGMMCGMCESHINDTIRKAVPVKKVSSSHIRGEAVVITDEPLDVEAVKAAVHATGYEVQSAASEPYEKKRFSLRKEGERRFYTNSQLKCLTERIRFFVLTKPSEVRRTGGTLNGTRQSQSEKDGARIKPF